MGSTCVFRGVRDVSLFSYGKLVMSGSKMLVHRGRFTSCPTLQSSPGSQLHNTNARSTAPALKVAVSE